MKELLLRKKRKKGNWKRRVSLVVALAVLFSLLPSNLVLFQLPFDPGKYAQAADFTIQDGRGTEIGEGDTYKMTSGSATFNLFGTTASKHSWTIGDTTVIQDNGSNATSITVKALKQGTSALTYSTWNETTDGSGQTVKTDEQVFSFIVKIGSMISGSMVTKTDGSGKELAKMAYVNPGAKRRGLILEQGEFATIGDGTSTTSPGEVNLLFTSGRTTNEKLVTWSSTDETVFKVMNNTPYSITAIGAGHAKLQVEVQEIGSSEDPETDEIDVYVKPRMQLGTYNNPLTDGTYDKLQNQTVELAKGDYVSVANLQDNTTVETNKDFQPIDEKIQWVIYQQKGSKNYLVSDSTGKPVDGYDEKDAKFEYLPSLTLKNGDLNAYQFTGRAGTYYVRFFPYGVWDRTYIDQISQLEGMFGFTATVQSAFKDTEITLNVGGSYNLSDALGIPEAILKSTDFTITSISQKPTGVVTNNANPAVLQASSTDEGDAVFQITRVANAYGEIPGVSNTAFVDDAANDAAPEGNKSRINITVHVRESFRINTSKTIMYTGQTLQLAGVFGTGTMPKGSTFRWDIAFADTTSAKPEDYLKLTPAEREDDPNAEVEALQETPRGNPLIVKLYWTSLEGITQLATCEITITESATEIKIDNDDPIRIGVGESVNVSVTTNYGDYKGLVWLSSDETIFHLDEEDEGERVRKITADKVGEAILLVMNPDNNTTTTHKVIVTQAMTDLKIKEGDTTVEMARGFLQLHAEWKPEDATSTEVKWLIAGDASVASIDQEGMLRFGGTPGSVTVTVTSTNNPTQLSDSCTVTITATQITNIELTESEITVIKGTTHQLVAKITPEDPYDKTLTWESQDITGKVSVDQNGLVTANEVGDATVTVYGGLAKPVSVLVHVTEKLESIAFDQSEYTVQVGKTVDMRVLFTPAENVNMEVTFTSTNTDIATVEKKVENGITAGVVTGVKVGDVMMIVTSTELGLEGAVSCMVHVIEPIIVADEFAVDPEKKTIKEGETFEITPVFTPANPTDQTVQYESSDESVATVSPEGIVKGISVSEVPVVITCTYVPTGKVALCLVTVESRVKLTLSPTKKTIVKGRSFTIKKTITPSKFKNTPAQWKSSNTKIATVSQAGKVTTKKVGTCVITCELVNYKVKATCTVKVTKVKTTIKLNKSSIRINIGQTYKLKSTVTSNDTKTPSVRYTSKNKKVATVGKTNGKIKGKKVGSTIITAKTTDAAHATARCRVTVIRRATSLNLNKNYAICFIGGTIRLKATVKPKSASIKKLQWSTSDDTIASVDQNGKVSGLQEGDIYITVKTTDGSNLSDRCYVRVMEEIPASSVTVAQTKLTMKKGDTANLSFTLLPTNTTDTVSMASDNKRVATVTDAGKITAVGTGTATITIMTTSGVISTVEVHVVDLNKSSIRMRQYDTDTLVVTGTDDTITWYSANNRIATVANGTVTGRAIGTTYIYAYVDGCKLACRVQIVSVNNNQR